jgi:NTP pyrophosphatase (non-canonical NTP hydrolase)
MTDGDVKQCPVEVEPGSLYCIDHLVQKGVIPARAAMPKAPIVPGPDQRQCSYITDQGRCQTLVPKGVACCIKHEAEWNRMFAPHKNLNVVPFRGKKIANQPSIGLLRDNHQVLSSIQHRIDEWTTRNFGSPSIIPQRVGVSPFLGMVEEMGEIAHHILKLEHGIRGSDDDHIEGIVDGIGDLMVFLLGFCAANGIDAERTLIRVWEKVEKRDWQRFPKNGKDE